MPVYEFLCEKCGLIEVKHSIHKGHPRKCPACKGKIKRFFGSMPCVKYNGRGWTTKYDGGIQPATSEEAKVPYR